ncbi:MAG: EI24 domain-containing protein [Bacteroidetes bacterium]|nr:EI24 domain-containing protein [Bacteroidota bacterium]
MFFKDFTASIKAYAHAFELANKLKLWKYCFVPIVIGLVVGTLIIVSAWFLADPMGQKISSVWPFEFGKETISSIGFFLGMVIILLVGVMVFKHAVMAFSAPFMAPLSERIEMHLNGNDSNQVNRQQHAVSVLLRGIRINVRNLVMETLITLPLVILSIIPVINIITTVLILYVQCYYAGYGNMDYTLERHLDYAATKKFVRQNRGIAVGNGFVFHLLLLIPLVGMMLALPLSTIAATTQTCARLSGPPKK